MNVQLEAREGANSGNRRALGAWTEKKEDRVVSHVDDKKISTIFVPFLE